jgi:predicted HicB family RNase H-like nuclease
VNTLSHRGYTAGIEYDERDGLFVGRILGIRSIVSFQSEAVNELRAEFEKAVADYLADCEEKGLNPEQPA